MKFFSFLQDPRQLDPSQDVELIPIFDLLKGVIGTVLVIFIIYLSIVYVFGSFLSLFYRLKEQIFKIPFLERMFLKPKSEKIVNKIIRFARKDKITAEKTMSLNSHETLKNVLEKQHEDVYPYILETINEKLLMQKMDTSDFSAHEIVYRNKEKKYLKAAKNLVVNLDSGSG